jgi:hypothetical protein
MRARNEEILRLLIFESKWPKFAFVRNGHQ